jgi:hypothetical protein
MVLYTCSNLSECGVAGLQRQGRRERLVTTVKEELEFVVVRPFEVDDIPSSFQAQPEA